MTAAIEATERFYAARDLPAIFAMSGAARPYGLDDTLAARGYQIVDPTLVMARDLPVPPDGTELSGSPATVAWKAENGVHRPR
ncbi:MAG: GCN5-related N-acetyltransferase [Streptosporangiaceae bacterium]|nr:GCN5-related N-acetyltransferase [Streptosporangiaceae bacterium]